jgi:hypothetical protein
MSIVLPHSEEFSFEGVSVDTYFTFRLTTTGTCGFSRKLKIFKKSHTIKVREKHNPIQRNWQHRGHKTKNDKAKTQSNMCWTSLCANKHK